MAQSKESAPVKVGHPVTLLLTISKQDIVRIGLPPRHPEDNYHDRAQVLGKLKNVQHVFCSLEGELFCVRDGTLYKGPLPSNKDVDWFSIAKKVGKSEWSKFKILFFHPNGQLYGTTKDGELYKGLPPSNENVPWMYEKATPIGSYRWDEYEFLFFDPEGNMFTVNKQDQIVKVKSPTRKFKEWEKSVTVIADKGKLKDSYFMSICPEGSLWFVNKKGKIYKTSILDDDENITDPKNMGEGYNDYRFLCFTKDKTISSIISFEFMPERGQKGCECLEVIEEKIYDNRNSSTRLKHNFTFNKSVKVSNYFSHEHGFTFQAGMDLTVKSGMPSVFDAEANVKVNMTKTYKWNFRAKNETETKFSSSSSVDVPPGKAIRVVATVKKSELSVPYRAKVKTLFGFETEIEGTWHGTAMYDVMVKQEDDDK